MSKKPAIKASMRKKAPTQREGSTLKKARTQRKNPKRNVQECASPRPPSPPPVERVASPTSERIEKEVEYDRVKF